MEDEEERDLSSWRVRVRDVGYKMDTTAVKNIPFYLLVVQRIDPMQGWLEHHIGSPFSEMGLYYFIQLNVYSLAINNLLA